jgi:hypothetical protein
MIRLHEIQQAAEHAAPSLTLLHGFRGSRRNRFIRITEGERVHELVERDKHVPEPFFEHGDFIGA